MHLEAPLLFLAFTFQQAPASAQRPDSARVDSAATPTATAVQTTRAPRIDGRLDEGAWVAAPAVTTFWQANPKEGAPAGERTEVRILYDDDAVYVGARLYERDARRIRTALTRRDADSPSDLFTVALDTYHDHQTAMVFSVNPLGVRSDRLTSADQQFGDDSWDPVWEAAALVDSLGWTAELRIPLSQLRFPPRGEQTWGVNFFRYRPNANESDAFVLVRQNEKGFASRFAHLVGIRGVPSPKRLELLPYARSQLESRRATPGDPFFDGVAVEHNAGIDLKYGVTSNLTLDATVNPDFGQVEADPAQLNLTVFETFFEERRPFFVEGAQIFAFGRSGGLSLSPGEVFYSRRVGRAPTLYPELAPAYAAGDSLVGPFTEIPKNTPILAAAKLSGRLGRGTSIGMLHAETGRVRGAVFVEQLYGRYEPSGTGNDSIFVLDSLVPVRYDDVLEPRGHFSVGRLKQDFRNGQTTVGAIYTHGIRDLNTPRLESLFRRDARTLGIDWQQRWAKNRFDLTGSVVWSSIRGSPAVIAAAQRSSARYYQRPDQTYAQFNPTRTSLAGRAATAKLRYDGPAGFGFSLGGNLTTPGYELNDLGYLTQADLRTLFTSAGWGTPKPTKHFRRVATEAVLFGRWNHGGERTGLSANLNFVAILQNNWGGFVGVGAGTRGLSTSATRGGPAILTSANKSANLSLFTDSRRSLSASVFGFLYRTDFGTLARSANASVSWRPTLNAELSLGPSYDYTREMGYLVTTVDDPTASATYGARYIFGRFEQHTLSLSMSANVTFTPALTFQLYVQPFTSGAAVSDFRELLRPRSLDFDYFARVPGTTARDEAGDYQVTLSRDGRRFNFVIPNPDASYRSLRGNAVLRWEYRPGATLFAVWTHGRNGYETGGAYGGLSDLSSLFGLPPENVFLLKANYWFSR
ncbi:MAG: DUF5916 domain-containing protein [Gemmatimonadaceae bacterium]